MTINIKDRDYASDILADLSELRIITGKTNQELIREALQEKYEHYKNLLKGSDK